MNKSFVVLFTVCYVLIGTSSCDQPLAYSSPHGYDLSKPYKIVLGNSQVEISGIAFLKGNSDTVYTINDEDGKLFYYNPGQKKYPRVKFAKNGDYEDVSIWNNKDILVLRSDGSIYRFPLTAIHQEEIDSTHEYKKLLPKGEYEGMFADGNQLYVLCKNCPSDEDANAVGIFVFQENNNGDFIQKNKLNIDLNKIRRQTGKSGLLLRPSALAKHPITHEWYILSSVNKMLLVTDEKFNVKAVHRLLTSTFRQPEGIAFNSQGDLYISNEGQEEEGNILIFKYQP